MSRETNFVVQKVYWQQACIGIYIHYCGLELLLNWLPTKIYHVIAIKTSWGFTLLSLCMMDINSTYQLLTTSICFNSNYGVPRLPWRQNKPYYPAEYIYIFDMKKGVELLAWSGGRPTMAETQSDPLPKPRVKQPMHKVIPKKKTKKCKSSKVDSIGTVCRLSRLPFFSLYSYCCKNCLDYFRTYLIIY